VFGAFVRDIGGELGTVRSAAGLDFFDVLFGKTRVFCGLSSFGGFVLFFRVLFFGPFFLFFLFFFFKDGAAG
jgi:hypothetical protein